jgi:arylsulfatase A-like enzyme
VNAPFQWTKQVASHFDGTRNGIVISWPAGISAQGEIRMKYSLNDAAAPDRRTTQYSEIFGNAGIYHDGWFASTTPQRLPWEPSRMDMDVLTGPWGQYNIDEDFSQAVNLAADMPEKLREMQVRFYAEATRYNVLSIDSSAVERFGEENRPSLTGDRTSFTFLGGLPRIPEGASPDVKNRSWTLTADTRHGFRL